MEGRGIIPSILRLIGTWGEQEFVSVQGAPSLFPLVGVVRREGGRGLSGRRRMSEPRLVLITRALSRSHSLLLCLSSPALPSKSSLHVTHTHTVNKKVGARLMAVSFQAQSERGGGWSRRVGQDPCHFCGGIVHNTERLKWHSEPNQQPAPGQNLYGLVPAPKLTLLPCHFLCLPQHVPIALQQTGLLPRSHISLDYTGSITGVCSSCQRGTASRIQTRTKNYSIARSGTEQGGGTTRADRKSWGRMIH